MPPQVPHTQSSRCGEMARNPRGSPGGCGAGERQLHSQRLYSHRHAIWRGRLRPMDVRGGAATAGRKVAGNVVLRSLSIPGLINCMHTAVVNISGLSTC